MTGVSRRFGTVQALDDASFTLRNGTVHALLGENGAGKTTLMRIAFGLIAADAGSIQRNGAPARITSAGDALALGIGMVHQHFTLVPAMTVAENVALGGHGKFRHAQAADRVRDVAARTGLSLDANAVVRELPVGAQQRCEIVKALARDVSVLIMDEPTSVLAPLEATELLAWMRRFADAGNAIVLITHKLRDALSVADDVTVLRRGRTVLASTAAAVDEAVLAEAMLGEPGAAVDTSFRVDMQRDASAGGKVPVHGQPESASPAVLVADHIVVCDEQGIRRIHDVTLSVHRGELVGIAAVEGSGHRELLRAMSGRLPIVEGTLTIPPDVGFVPEDRHRDALMLEASLVDNVALRGAGERRGMMSWQQVERDTNAIIAKEDVRASDIRSMAGVLSGGNQQKLVLGRELANEPAALVVENPTRGLDFRATRAVHDAMRDACTRGTAILLYSSDIDEVLSLADRVVALHDGRAVAVPNEREAVGRAMLGAS